MYGGLGTRLCIGNQGTSRGDNGWVCMSKCVCNTHSIVCVYMLVDVARPSRIGGRSGRAVERGG